MLSIAGFYKAAGQKPLPLGPVHPWRSRLHRGRVTSNASISRLEVSTPLSPYPSRMWPVASALSQ